MQKNIIYLIVAGVLIIILGLSFAQAEKNKQAAATKKVLETSTDSTNQIPDTMTDEEAAAKFNQVETPKEFLPSVETNDGKPAVVTPPKTGSTSSPQATPTPAPAPAPTPKTYAVSIANFAFAPASITIKKGDSVTFTNNDGMTHTATGSNFDTGNLSNGASKTIQFNTPGTFTYHCSIHGSMSGTIVVQ